MRPLVSICIPTYNRASLLKCAIASAQKQTYPNIEIIVTDNCSTDETEQVVKEIIKNDPRVRYIRNETNVGPTRNWQIAVNAAKGEFCKILYSDDEIAEEFISSCIEKFEDGNDVAFVVTDTIVGPSFNSISASRCALPEGHSNSSDYIIKYLLCEINIYSPSCALFRTQDLVSKIVLKNPIFETDRYSQNGAGPDSLIFLNAASSHDEIAYIRKPLTLFRTCDDSISTCAAKNEDALTQLQICYAKARYHFFSKITGTKQPIWYFQFLSTQTGAATRKAKIRQLIVKDFKLKYRHKITIFDFAMGLVMRQFKDQLVKPRIKQYVQNIKIRPDSGCYAK